MTKYDLLLDDTITLECGTLLFRIKAHRELVHPTLGPIARKGELGGYIYSHEGLSHEGNAWVSEQGQVIEGRVTGDALVSGYARVFGGRVQDRAVISGSAIVAEQATIMDDAYVINEAKAVGRSIIRGNSKLTQRSLAEDNAELFNAQLTNCAKVSINGVVKNAEIRGDYVVQNEAVLGIAKGEKAPHRYGCNYHAARYDQDKAHLQSEKPFLTRHLGTFFPALLGKKYKLLKRHSLLLENGITVYRIKALVAIPEHNVKRGDLGGYIQDESNLSHLQGAWVGASAIVYEDAVVAGCAFVSGSAKVRGRAVLSHQCIVRDEATVSGNAIIMDIAMVGEQATISDDTVVCGQAVIKGQAHLSGNAQVHDKSLVDGSARVDRIGQLRGHSHATGNAHVSDLLPRNTTAKEPLY